MSVVWIRIARKKGDRHWWHVAADGMTVHALVCFQVITHGSGLWILQFIAGPLMVGFGPFGTVTDQQAKPDVMP